MEKIVVRTDPYDFGLVVPMKTGIIFEHQCDGYACNQLQQEGIFIPLSKRYFSFCINDLGDTEYYFEEEKMPFHFELAQDKDISKMTKWEKIHKIREITFQEAWEWIIFKGWKNKTHPEAKEWDKLIGKKVMLIYPNSGEWDKIGLA